MGVLILCAALAVPDVGDPNLERAFNLYRGLEYAAALAPLKRAFKKDLAPNDYRAALALAGRLYAVLNKPVRAQRYFVELLRLVPGFTVSEDESPFIQKAFDAAQRDVAAERARTDTTTTTAGTSTGEQPYVRELPGDDDGKKEEEGDYTWWIVGGSAAVTVAVVVTLIALLPDGGNPANLGQWDLP